jgi:3-oxoacyl-[acyl-carrier protein] reductase
MAIYILPHPSGILFLQERMVMANSSKVLADKVALVTGGSRGIGAAICRHLAAAGAKVLINYARSADAAKKLAAEIAAAGGQAIAVGGDISDEGAVLALFGTIDREHGGRVDILVNNAGTFVVGPLVETSTAEFDRVMATNVRAVFLVSREAAKRMPEGGRVITIGSGLGERAVGPNLATYVASKFAVAGLARAMAHDLGPRKITSNLVQPGPVDTDMNPADPEKNPMATSMRESNPLKRYGHVDEVAAAVAFLASPAAAYVNGATLNVDGGGNA